MTRYTHVTSGVQILFVINMRQQVVRLGTAKIYFLKKKTILNTVHIAEDDQNKGNTLIFLCTLNTNYLVLKVERLQLILVEKFNRAY